jgi:hypothetical protein
VASADEELGTASQSSSARARAAVIEMVEIIETVEIATIANAVTSRAGILSFLVAIFFACPGWAAPSY